MWPVKPLTHLWLQTKKKEVGFLLAPPLPSFLSLSPRSTPLFFPPSSITSHLVPISLWPLSELPAHYNSSVWDGRKSAERSKPFISRGRFNLCSAGCSVSAWGYIVRSSLCEIVNAEELNSIFTESFSLILAFFFLHFVILTEKAACTSHRLFLSLSSYRFRWCDTSHAQSPSVHQSRLWARLLNRIFTARVCLVLFIFRLHQNESSHLDNVPQSVLNYIACSQSNHTLQ